MLAGSRPSTRAGTMGVPLASSSSGSRAATRATSSANSRTNARVRRTPSAVWTRSGEVASGWGV
eukprot:1141982-Alexandrium_andersonii.AAC.1